jgi:NADPH-dependent 2,4-dienoyl-CoA reductase/sulfur reductase-like enzyme
MSPGANNEGFQDKGRENGGVTDNGTHNAVEDVVVVGAGPAGLMLA